MDTKVKSLRGLTIEDLAGKLARVQAERSQQLARQMDPNDPSPSTSWNPPESWAVRLPPSEDPSFESGSSSLERGLERGLDRSEYVDPKSPVLLRERGQSCYGLAGVSDDGSLGVDVTFPSPRPIDDPDAKVRSGWRSAINANFSSFH